MNTKSTGISYLRRDTDSDVYYAVKKVRGRLVWRSLGTTKLWEAKAILPDKIKEIEDERQVITEAKVSPSMTFREAMEVYRAEVEVMAIRSSSKVVRMRREATLKRCWPDIFDRPLRSFTDAELKRFIHEFRGGKSVYKKHNGKLTLKGDSPTTINGLIRFLHAVFEVGVRNKIIRENPAAHLKRAKPREKLMNLPNKQEWAKMLEHTRDTPGWGRKAADLIEGLAYSGMRVGESRRSIWSHVDFGRGVFYVLPDKGEVPRAVPMNAALRELLQRMYDYRCQHHGKPQPTDKIFECGSAAVMLPIGIPP
ncbi:MAG: tyrosine-type recombinase/integrase [Verrucomicrobia bacterium]|nr:tyrosine-type recombinase/integrase [Verrucomicrobiota bacterium]